MKYFIFLLFFACSQSPVDRQMSSVGKRLTWLQVMSSSRSELILNHDKAIGTIFQYQGNPFDENSSNYRSELKLVFSVSPCPSEEESFVLSRTLFGEKVQEARVEYVVKDECLAEVFFKTRFLHKKSPFGRNE